MVTVLPVGIQTRAGRTFFIDLYIPRPAITTIITKQKLHLAMERIAEMEFLATGVSYFPCDYGALYHNGLTATTSGFVFFKASRTVVSQRCGFGWIALYIGVHAGVAKRAILADTAAFYRSDRDV